MNTIPVIEEFLQQWKIKSFKYYHSLGKEFYKQSRKKYDINKGNLDSIKDSRSMFFGKLTEEKIGHILSELPNMSEREKQNLSGDITYIRFNRWCSMYSRLALSVCRMNDTDLNKFLDKEVKAKRNNLIARIQKKAGEIIDASGLYIAANGEINGKIIGSIKTVTVETITAGGYNVQCFHFRVLVK